MHLVSCKLYILEKFTKPRDTRVLNVGKHDRDCKHGHGRHFPCTLIKVVKTTVLHFQCDIKFHVKGKKKSTKRHLVCLYCKFRLILVRKCVLTMDLIFQYFKENGLEKS